MMKPQNVFKNESKRKPFFEMNVIHALLTHSCAFIIPFDYEETKVDGKRIEIIDKKHSKMLKRKNVFKNTAKRKSFFKMYVIHALLTHSLALFYF